MMPRGYSKGEIRPDLSKEGTLRMRLNVKKETALGGLGARPSRQEGQLGRDGAAVMRWE